MPVTIDDMEIEEESWCEHCGNLPPFDITWNASTKWCLSCAECDPKFDLSEKDLNTLLKMQLTLRREYHLKELEDLGLIVTYSEAMDCILVVKPIVLNVDSDIVFDDDCGDVMDLNEFIDSCECNSFIDYDGYAGKILLNGKVVYGGSLYPTDALIQANNLLSLQKKLGKLQIVWYNR